MSKRAYKRRFKAIKEKIKLNENKLFGVEEEIQYKNNLNQAYIARELAKWIKSKAQIKSMISKSIGESKYYVENNESDDISITGGSPFSAPGLGYTNSAFINHNQFTDSNKLNTELKTIFDKIWSNDELVRDVKREN